MNTFSVMLYLRGHQQFVMRCGFLLVEGCMVTPDVNSGEVISMTHVLQVFFLSVFILQVVMHGEESQVPRDLRQSEILIEQDFKI
jgi:hypothetical protein